MTDINKLFTRSAQAHQPLAGAYARTAAVLANTGAVSAVAAAAVANLESRSAMTSQDVDTLEQMHSSFVTLFGDLHDQLSSNKRQSADGAVVVSNEAMQSRAALGFAGALMASSAKMDKLKSQALAAVPTVTATGAPAFAVDAVGSGYHSQRSIYTAEAFNNYDLNNSRIFSALFNYSVVDFDDFTRTFWRPVTVSPDSTFVELLVNVLTVFNGYEHNADGKGKDWQRHNLVRAVADHTVLNTDLTKAIPSKTAKNAAMFMTKVGESGITQADQDIVTAPLLVGADNMNYISLCMPDWLVKGGTLDQRDSLDPAVRIDKLYLALENDVLEFPVKNMPGTEFNAAAQEDRQKLSLNWTVGSLKVNAKTLNVDGSALADLAEVVSAEMVLAIRLDVHAELNIETGDLVFNTGKPSIRSLQDKDGNNVSATDARFIALNAALKKYTEVGFTLEAFRSNANRRQRGQLINIRQFAENVVVPWRDPIAVERPAHASGEQDTSDLTALMSATRIRIANEGITALFDAEQVLASTVVDEKYDSFSVPATIGVGRHWVLPYYSHEVLDMLDVVDSLRSGKREEDIQAAIVATMRNRIAHAYTDSQYKAASDALSGGTAGKPKVGVVCDPVTARYILEPGELRTLVDFELIVVPVLDFRMRGKMKMVFLSDDGGTEVNYLNWGYLFWSAEHVLVANMTRGNAYNRETQLMPRYRHYVACPVMVSIDIVNIEEALKKVAVKTDEQNPAPAPAPAPAPVTP